MINGLFGVFKRKKFWLFIFIASLFGAVYFQFFYDSIYDKIDRSKEVYICFVSNEKRLTINSVSDSLEVQAYFDLIFGNTEYVKYRGSGLTPDQRIYLVKNHHKYPLSKIVAYLENSTMGNARFYEGWIWNEYLHDEPCEN